MRRHLPSRQGGAQGVGLPVCLIRLEGVQGGVVLGLGGQQPPPLLGRAQLAADRQRRDGWVGGRLSGWEGWKELIVES